ncbi:response regulator transcription factor [Sphingobium aquiterrae]|uniref:response regulator transcription factor n=1 Tax=Sphingobium aquiterrae TaxID=2038656 RepID=UPI003015A5C0
MQIFTRKRDKSERTSPARRIRLLVVDENATALSVIGRRLAHMGYDVTLAENGFAAINMLMAQKFDLILIESAMKLLGGIATMRKMRASGMVGGASIMMITGRSDSAAIIEALDAGADDQIVKPFDFDVLGARIRHVVARAQRIDELSRFNEQLDARIARRAVELGEARAALDDMTVDRSRLVASIQALHDEIERLNTQVHG